jgi:hypothetical protein
MRSEQVIKAAAAPPRYSPLSTKSLSATRRKNLQEIDCDYVFSDAATGAE